MRTKGRTAQIAVARWASRPARVKNDEDIPGDNLGEEEHGGTRDSGE